MNVEGRRGIEVREAVTARLACVKSESYRVDESDDVCEVSGVCSARTQHVPSHQLTCYLVRGLVPEMRTYRSPINSVRNYVANVKGRRD